MAKSKLILFDTGVVSRLHEVGLWLQVINRYDVYITEVVANECDDYNQAGRPKIDIRADATAEKLTLVSLPASEVIVFRNRFKPLYRDRLDPGESEALAYAFRPGCVHRVCSADGSVFKAMAALNESERCMSLEMLLKEVGMERKGPLPMEWRQSWAADRIVEGKRDWAAGKAT